MKKEERQLKCIAGLLILFGIVMTSILFPQDSSDIKFERISRENGLSQLSVNYITQDKKGFMWFATQDGLNQYDGYGFTVYSHDRDVPNSISANHIRVILEDPGAGIMWIATSGGGLNKFDPVKGIFSHYLHDPQDPTSLSEDSVFSLYQDRRGVLWVGTWGGGLNKFDKNRETFTHYKYDPNNPYSLSNDLVRAIFEDSNGVMWIGTYGGGLNQFDREKERFINYRHDPHRPDTLSDDRIMNIVEAKSGLLWIATDGGGINSFDPTSGVFTLYQHDVGSPGTLSYDRVRFVYEDRLGVLWVGTFGGGLNIFDSKSGQFAVIKHDPLVSESLSDDQMLCVFEDNTGLLWFGTNYGGVNKYDRQRKKFMHYQYSPIKRNSLSDPQVRAIYQDHRGILWIGTNDAGLNKLDRQTNTYTHYRYDPHKPGSLPSDRVYAIAEDREKTLWIGTFGGGLGKFDREKESFIQYKNNPQNPYSLSNNQVRVIHEDRQGVLWVGTWNGGLDRFDREKGVFYHYQHNPKDPFTISNNYIFALHEDPDGLLWIGTWGGGLCRYNRANDNFTRFMHDPDNRNSLRDNQVYSICDDSRGNLWVGTTMGLDKFDKNKNNWIHYSAKDGLPNETINGLLTDEEGNLWISTNGGISRFDASRGTFKNYGLKDGLQGYEFIGGACYKSRSGEMFFGGLNGMNSFFPGEIKDNPHKPAVVITGFRKFNQPVPWSGAISEMDNIQLSHKDNFITFDFVALNYRASGYNQYAYKLEGFDNDWIYCGTQRSASYTNLQGGMYVFRVKGSNNDGIWNEEGASIAVVVTPSFWQTWWFRIVVISGVLFLIFLIYEVRTQAIRKTNKKLKDVNIQLNQQIEERKQAEKALQASEKKYRKIIENTVDVYYRANLDGKLVMASLSAVSLLGYESLDEMLGRDVAGDFYLNPGDRAPLLDALKTNGKVVNYEVALKRKDGSSVIVETTSYFSYNEEGKPEAVEGIFRDITARKRAEEENIRLQEQLLNARKMEAVGNLAGGMAHEFNNLLAVITGYAELLQEEIGEDTTVSRQLAAIKKAANRCSALTDQLLSFSRKQVLRLKAVDINNLITNMEGRIQQIMSEKVKVVTKFEAKPIRINVDPHLMSQVIIGIVENSRDAMPHGGVLTIQTEIVELDKENNNNSQPVFHQQGKFVCLTIEDTGIGMDEEILKHIFEPFFTTKEVGKGVGLDLSFVYGTIGQHGGWLDAASTPGEGTVMKIYLPVSI